MKTWVKVLIVTVVFGIAGFLFESAGPIGSVIWPMAEGLPDPEGTDLGLLMFEGVLEAVAFGLGAAFLIFGYSWVNRVSGSGRPLTLLAYLSIAWGLINWVPHTALHMNHGNLNTPADFGGLIAIEYGFHVTLMTAAGITALFFVRALQTQLGLHAPTIAPAPATARASRSPQLR